MKKIVAFVSVLFLLFSFPILFAQMPVGVPTTPVVSPQTFERIGVVAAALGKVELKTPGQAGRIAESGQPVFVGDEVTTDEKGHLQILLLDETVFTIGPNSAITIDRFVYDPQTRGGEIKASVAKGVFRYVSGKIAVKNPNNVTVKLPTATLGFRGTIVGGSVGADGQGLVGLLGPGGNNDAGAQTGSFTIEGLGGETEDVNRTGFGVGIGENGNLSDVFQFSEDQINQLTQGLGGDFHGSSGNGQGGGLGGNTDMGGLSGETGALTGQNGAFTEGLNNLGDNLINDSNQVAQDKTTGSEISTSNITTYEQLIAATTEPSHYAGDGTYSYEGGSGSIHGQANIVFGPDGSIGGGGYSFVSISAGDHNDNTSLGGEGTSFSGKSGPTTDLSWHETTERGGIFDITATLSNSNGVIAQNAVVNVTYTNPGGTAGSILPASGNGTASGTLSSGPIVP